MSPRLLTGEWRIKELLWEKQSPTMKQQQKTTTQQDSFVGDDENDDHDYDIVSSLSLFILKILIL